MDDTLNGTEEGLAKRPINDEADRKTQQAMMVPAGSYVTVPPLTKTVFINETDDREVTSYFAHIRGEKGEGRVRFRVSHVARFRDDGAPDNASKLWLGAKKVYAAAYGRVAQYVEDVYDHLSMYPVGVRVIQGDEDNVVVGIFQPR